MSNEENIEKLRQEFISVNNPMSLKRLQSRLGLNRKYIQFLLCSNPDLFERANPNEVGSGKWHPDKNYLDKKNMSKASRLRKVINIWKLK